MTDPDHRLVARVVAVLSERTPAQGDLLASTLAARWSASDPHEPAAHEWLRPGAARARVSAPLDAEAGALHCPRVHVRGGPLPGLQLVQTAARGGCRGGPS